MAQLPRRVAIRRMIGAPEKIANLGYFRLLAIFSSTAFDQKKVRSQSIAGNLLASAQFGR